MEEHLALYRRFRPQTFDDIVEQKEAVTALRQSITDGRIGHAYLFCGQHGTGKTTIAKVFARAVNCEHPVGGNPCNECPTCKGILNGSILDVIEMDAASNNSVDNIRQITEQVNFAPSAARYKVYIIDEVHMLSQGAFNALLKTLEEPPKHVIFLFATTEVHKIPSTILSRCQRYDFKRISRDKIIGRLRYVADKENIPVEDEALSLIAAQSDGAMRDALTLLDQMRAVTGGRKITGNDVEEATGTVDNTFLFKTANALIDARFDELMDLMAELHESGRDYVKFTLELAHYFRDLLVIRVMPDPSKLLPYTADTVKAMYVTANKVSADTLSGYITYLSKEASEFKWSPDITTSFEIMMLRLCGKKSRLPVEPLVIPDFAARQAEAARKISFAAPETPAAEKEPEPEEPAKEEDPEPSAAPVSIFAKQKEAMKVKEEEPATEAEDTPDAPEPEEPAESESQSEELPGQSSLFSFLSSSPFNTSSQGSGSDDAEDEHEPDDEPAGSDEPDEPAPAPEKEDAPNHFLAGLHSSFLDDLKLGTEDRSAPEPEPEPAPAPEPAPVHTTQLAEQMDRVGLIVDTPKSDIRVPEFNADSADITVRWKRFIAGLPEESSNAAATLERSSMRLEGDSAYIVFANEDAKLMTNLKKTPALRTIAPGIKKEFSSDRLFLCTEDQYRNMLRAREEDEAQRRAEELQRLAQEKGIDTNVHFGDDD